VGVGANSNGLGVAACRLGSASVAFVIGRTIRISLNVLASNDSLFIVIYIFLHMVY
jgi:hypothetical protein